MLSSRRLSLVCSKAVFNGRQSNVSIRKFSSKNPNNRNKNYPKIEVTAKNDFVTHQLNSSIAAHLMRQQKLWNNAVEEEKKFRENRSTDYYFNENTDEIERTGYHSRNKAEKTHPQNHSKKYPNKGARPIQKATIAVHGAQEFDEDDLSENDSDDFDLEELEPPNWEDMNLVAIKKDFYKPSTMTENRSSEEIREFNLKAQVTAGSDSPKPIFKFDELNDLSQLMIAEVEKRRFIDCTPVQSHGIPITLSGANMIAVSPLSTGKSLAMILSAIIHISHQTSQNEGVGPIAVILTLTHEVAEETRQLADAFCREANIKCTVFDSNVANKGKTHIKLSDVGELVIATPCHLYELLRTKSIRLEKCSQFSLYEADKMIEMCLDDEILQIESQLRPDCQRLIWSSSWTSELRKLIVDNYARLEVGSLSVKENLSENISQIVKVSQETKKKDVLLEIIHSLGKEKTLIFTESPEKSNKVANILGRNGYQSKPFHNQMSTVQRDAILSDFQDKKFQFLVLTDVAAKNVNFRNISNVVNYDMPLSISDYVYRAKRTGRSENGIGNVYSIVSEEDGDLVDDLIGILQQTKQAVDPALYILKAANADSDDEVAFAIPQRKGFKKYIIDNAQK